jgi:hypothetical protein
MLNDLGRHREGAEQARRAAQLEPLSPMILGLAGWNIAFEDVDAGLRLQRRAVEIDPDHPIANLFLATTLVERIGAYEEALPYIERSLTSGSKLSLALLVLALSKTGRTDRLTETEARISAMQAKELMPNWIAALRAVALSDQDAFIHAIDQAVETGEFPTGNVAVWSFADFVRDDPRFHAILGRIGLGTVPGCPTSGFRPAAPPSKSQNHPTG